LKNTNSPVHIVATIKPKPRFYNEGLEALKRLLEPTRAEIGCIRFDVFEDADRLQYVLVEHFKSQADLEFHYEQPYTKSVFALYETILENAPEIHYLTPIVK